MVRPELRLTEPQKRLLARLKRMQDTRNDTYGWLVQGPELAIARRLQRRGWVEPRFHPCPTTPHFSITGSGRSALAANLEAE